MPFSYDQRNKIENHLRLYQPRCPVCASASWTYFDDLIYSGILDSEYKQPIQGKVYPLITVSCNTCGHILQFSAGHLGMV